MTIEKLIPYIKTREEQISFLEKLAEPMWNRHQALLNSGMLPSSIPKYKELSETQKDFIREGVERVLFELREMGYRIIPKN